MKGPLWTWICRGFEGLCSMISDLSDQTPGPAPGEAIRWLRLARDWIERVIAREEAKKIDGREDPP